MRSERGGESKESTAMPAEPGQSAGPAPTLHAGAGGAARLGRYLLQRRLGRGGMGELYLGVASGPGGFERKVAIKRILPHLAQSESFVQRFIDEARIVVQLQHGNIVPVFDMGVHRDEYYIAMEYLPGWDLKAVLREAERQARPVPVGLVLLVGLEVARGLAYAHRKTDDDGRGLGIVHRDISPSNILLGSDGVVKITDFGIAKAAGKLVESVAGMLQGKFAYMSPEQAAGLDMDLRSDIFSLGVVLWEAVTGRQLFAAESDTATLRRIRTHTPEPTSDFRPEVPRAVDDVLRCCLARERDARPADAEALEQSLSALLLDHYPGTSASQLALYLSELFPDQTRPTPVPEQPASFDDLLRVGLADLGGGQAAGDHVDPGATTQASGPLQDSAQGERPRSRRGDTTGRRALSPTDTRPPDADRTDFRLRAPGGSAPGTDPALGDPRTVPTPAPATRRAVRSPLLWVALAAALVLGGAMALSSSQSHSGATLELRTTPGEAYVLVDGVLVSPDPTPERGTLAVERLPEGRELRLSLIWPGYPPLEHTLRLRSGEHLFLDGLTRRRPSRYEEAARAAEAAAAEWLEAHDPPLASLGALASPGDQAPARWRASTVVDALRRKQPLPPRSRRGPATPLDPAAADTAPVPAAAQETGWVGVRCMPWGRPAAPGHVRKAVNPVEGSAFFELPVGHHTVRCVNATLGKSMARQLEVRAWPRGEVLDHVVVIRLLPDDQWLAPPAPEEAAP